MAKPAPGADEAITAGHRTIGRVEERSGHHVAFGATGSLLGSFSTRSQARRAVHLSCVGQVEADAAKSEGRV